jgi:hypothetical protein
VVPREVPPLGLEPLERIDELCLGIDRECQGLVITGGLDGFYGRRAS